MYGRNVRQILTEAQMCRYSLGDFESRRTTVPSRNRRAITQAIEIAQEPLAHARKFRLAFGPVKVGFGAILLKKSLLRELIRGSRNHTSSMAEKAECYFIIYLHQDREFRESSADRLFQTGSTRGGRSSALPRRLVVGAICDLPAEKHAADVRVRAVHATGR